MPTARVLVQSASFSSLLRNVVRRSIAVIGICWLAALHAQAGTKDLPTAPAWTLKDLDGKTVHLSDFAGRVVVLNFWATWCAPCRKEIPGFAALQRKYGATGLIVIGISLDDDPQLVKAAVRNLGIILFHRAWNSRRHWVVRAGNGVAVHVRDR